jgi:hypothetical protein
VRKQRWRRWLAVVAAVIFVAATAAVLVHYLTRESELDRLKREIRAEVPLGSTIGQVAAWYQRRLGRVLQDNRGPYAEKYRGTTLPEAAGVPWKDVASVVDVTVPCGWYVVNGRVGPNHLWVFFTFNEAGQVVDYHFLTLEELARIEQGREKQRPE